MMMSRWSRALEEQQQHQVVELYQDKGRRIGIGLQEERDE